MTILLENLLAIACLHLSTITRLMILILTISVKYMVNHLSILEAIVQNVPARILGNRLLCQQNAEYGANLANDVSKTGELLQNLLNNCSMHIFRKLLQSILLTNVTRTLISEASETKTFLKGIYQNEK